MTKPSFLITGDILVKGLAQYIEDKLTFIECKLGDLDHIVYKWYDKSKREINKGLSKEDTEQLNKDLLAIKKLCAKIDNEL